MSTFVCLTPISIGMSGTLTLLNMPVVPLWVTYLCNGAMSVSARVVAWVVGVGVLLLVFLVLCIVGSVTRRHALVRHVLLNLE